MGIDLSLTSTGVCILTKRGQIMRPLLIGRIMTTPQRFNSEDERMNFICDTLVELSHQYNVDTHIIENQYLANNRPTIMALRKLLGMLARALYKETKGVVDYISTTKARKALTKKGRSKKEKVAEHIIENYIYVGEYNDRAGLKKTSDMYDAIALALAACLMEEENND